VVGKLADNLTLATGAWPEDPSGRKRHMQINGVACKSANDLNDHASFTWLTPQMDGLFLADASDRRKFFDRLLYVHQPSFAKHLARYDHALRERNRLLKTPNTQSWRQALTPTLVQEGVAIAAARVDFAQRLQATAQQLHLPFAIPHLVIDGTLENMLLEKPASMVEDWFTSQLNAPNSPDIAAGSTQIGTHRSDFVVAQASNAQLGALCSTGEQKSLLIAIMLAHTQLLQKSLRPHVLLLDDIVAHLDEHRRQNLLSWLAENNPGQVWLSGTEAELVDVLQAHAQFVGIAS
jgi:DNA replication and repair protein RecF